MSNVIKFTSAKLANTGKKGILRPDEEGYYEIIVGGLNTFNSVGQYYTAEGVKELFSSSSALMRRINNSALKAEYGHPSRSPGMTDDDYIRRIITIDERNVCAAFKDISLDLEYGKNNPELQNPSAIAILAKIKPTGPMGDYLKKSLDSAGENVCFSIRALTKDYYSGGKMIRVLNTIVTFDLVNEGGISFASKLHSPAVESFQDVIVTKRKIDTLAKHADLVSTESSKAIISEISNAFKPVATPLYTKW